MAFLVEEFVPVADRPPIIGLCRVRTPLGLVFHDVTIRKRNGAVWAMPGRSPALNTRGRQIRNRDGELRWTPIVSFADPELEARFSDAVIEALLLAYPDALHRAVSHATAGEAAA